MSEVSLVQCACGLVITSPRPEASEIGAHYPATYYSYTPTAPSERGERFKALSALISTGMGKAISAL